MRSGTWTIVDVMRYNDRLDDEDEMELDAAERSRMEQRMGQLQADMRRRSKGGR